MSLAWFRRKGDIKLSPLKAPKERLNTQGSSLSRGQSKGAQSSKASVSHEGGQQPLGVRLTAKVGVGA
jgi:hypothetical protein